LAAQARLPEKRTETEGPQWRTLAGLLLVDEPAAAFGKDRRQADRARAVLLAAVGRESSDAAAVWGDGTKDCGLAGGDGIALLDNSRTPKGEPLHELQRQHPRLHIEHFPSYAPELNPDEGVWSLAKRKLANGRPDDLHELMYDLIRSIESIRRSPAKLRGCILLSELPPLDECVRLDDNQLGTPVKYPAQQRHPPSGRIGRAIRFEFTLLKKRPLLSEEQILSRHCDTGSSEEEYKPREVDQHLAEGCQELSEARGAAS